jgi:hypothetical protein
VRVFLRLCAHRRMPDTRRRWRVGSSRPGGARRARRDMLKTIVGNRTILPELGKSR